MAEAAVCVYCRQRRVEARYRPFCSERCRMADLGRWLGGGYRVAAGPAFDASGTSEPSEDSDVPEGPET